MNNRPSVVNLLLFKVPIVLFLSTYVYWVVLLPVMSIFIRDAHFERSFSFVHCSCSVGWCILLSPIFVPLKIFKFPTELTVFTPNPTCVPWIELFSFGGAVLISWFVLVPWISRKALPCCRTAED